MKIEVQEVLIQPLLALQLHYQQRRGTEKEITIVVLQDGFKIVVAGCSLATISTRTSV